MTSLTAIATKEILSKSSVSSSAKVLLILAAYSDPIPPTKILAFGLTNGARKLKNVPQLLVGLGDKVIRTPAGWEISREGREWLQKKGHLKQSKLSSLAEKLSDVAKSIPSADTVSFVDEAIGCIHMGYFRSAIILSWVGAFSLLQAHIVSHHLSSFNAEASAKKKITKPLSSVDEISEHMKEFDVIDTCHKIGILSKNLRDQLHAALKVRNAASHPNSFQIGEAAVANHVEMLLLNIYKKF
jgi:hypothetical protein